MTDQFKREMEQWAEQHGSERLRVGLADGYRMVGVYLQERAEHEAGSGFYAWRQEAAPRLWVRRNDPTEDALLLRRQVQARLAAITPDDQPILEAEIVWLKQSPEQICDLPLWEQESCEAIVIRGWLDHYTLVGVVRTDKCPALHVADQFTVGVGA